MKICIHIYIFIHTYIYIYIYMYIYRKRKRAPSVYREREIERQGAPSVSRNVAGRDFHFRVLAECSDPVLVFGVGLST